jgi:peptidoglycan/LPS O-acetylase OafA/YrhL
MGATLQGRARSVIAERGHRMSQDRPHAGDHVGALDGLRGLAALWVFFSHVQILSGLRPLPVLSWGDSAVDLFMMISGFLMVHHYLGRVDVEPWARPRTWIGFWLRRLFRIAPAYYVLLAAALVAGPWLGHDRAVIGAHYPWTLTRDDRYANHGIANVLTHVTFVFGALPGFGFSTPLPDWSIGLEMQFYLVMPFLMLALGRRLRWPRALLLVMASMLLAFAVRGYSAHFDMPSFLPMKLGVFLIGMFVAYGVARRDLRAPAALVLVIVAAAVAHRRDHATLTLAVMAAGFMLLVGGAYLPGVGALHRGLMPIRRVLASPLGHWAGESAYSLYLVHLLILLPVAAWLTTFDDYLQMKSSLRFALAGAITLVVSLALATLIHRWIELPGIVLGKQVVRRMRRKPALPAPESAAGVAPEIESLARKAA